MADDIVAMMSSLADSAINAFAYLVVLGFAAIPAGAAFIVVALARGWFSLADIFGGNKKTINQ